MSQPPQPPQSPQGVPPEKPVGGFGAPQDSPPAGFGAPPAMPPQPPGQPAYGYPQMPPAPPGAPQSGGYGYPGQPPQTGGYGYPGQPPQYGGYPPQPPLPDGAPSPGGGKSKRRLAVIVSSVVALVLVAGGGVWFATKDDGKHDKAHGADNHQGNGGNKDKGGKEDKPKSQDGRMLFGVDQPEVPSGRFAPGMWATDKVFAKAGLFKITGYGPTGGQQWELPLDGETCWASPHVTADGKTAVLVRDKKPEGTKFGSGGQCTEVIALDLNNGRKLWQKSLKGDDQTLSFNEVTVGNGVVAAGSLSGGAAWSLADGKELWKPQPTTDCVDRGYGGGNKLVAVRRCGDYDHPLMKIQTLKPNGAVLSSFTLPNNLAGANVVSTDPLVVAIKAGSDSSTSGASDFMVIDDSAKDGKLRSKISAGNGTYDPHCDSLQVESCKTAMVGKDTLYLPTRSHQTGKAGADVNEIVGFDLASGQSKGKAEGRKSSELTPLTVDQDGYLIAYQTPGWQQGGQVVRLDPKTFALDVLLRNPASTSRVEEQISMGRGGVLWSQNRLYLGRDYISETSRWDKDKKYLATVWGAN